MPIPSGRRNWTVLKPIQSLRDGRRVVDRQAYATLGLLREPPLLRAFARLCQFDLATSRGPGEVAVRTTIPPVNRRHTRRLPANLPELEQSLHPDQSIPPEKAC